MEYRFAVGKGGALLDIHLIHNETRHRDGPYQCAGCSGEMIPVLGKTVEHHFRHKRQNVIACTPETYLHAAAKQAIAGSFTAAVQSGEAYPLKRQRPVVCTQNEARFGYVCRDTTEQFNFDLTQWLSSAVVEKKVGGFIGDVVLENEDGSEVLLVEIAVTHPCSAKKIASGLKIIEVKVENEDDVEALRTGLQIDGKKTVGYNLKPAPPLVKGRCTGCNAYITAFVVYESGKVILLTKSPTELARVHQNKHTLLFELVDTTNNDNQGYRELLDFCVRRAAFDKGISFRNCLLCRHSDFAREIIPIAPLHCFKGYGVNNKVSVNQAVECESYTRFKDRVSLERHRDRMEQRAAAWLSKGRS